MRLPLEFMDAVAKDLMSCKRPTFDFSKSAFQPASDRHPQASRRVFDRYLLLVAGQTIFVNEGVARGTWWSQGESNPRPLECHSKASELLEFPSLSLGEK
jgi:hypothetical protein